MRTLVLLLATSTLVLLLPIRPASAGTPAAGARPDAAAIAVATGPEAAPRIRLLTDSTGPGPGGGRRVRYTVLQHVGPLLAVNETGAEWPDVVVDAGDVVSVSWDWEAAGWEAIGTLTVEQYAPAAPASASAATASAATGASQAAGSEPLVLAIAPVRPEPVRGGTLVVDVALPSAGPARLEMLDVMGRRVAERELGTLGAGRHTVDLAAGRGLAPGVYLLRLTQAGEARVARVTVID